MFSGSKAVPATICPPMVNVATRMTSGRRPGPEHGGGRSERGLAEGNGREGRDRMIGKTTTRHDDGARAGRPHGRGGGLRHDDGADDVNRIGRLQVLDARGQERVRSSHDSVVDDEPGRTLLAVERSHPRSERFGVAGIRRDRVDLGAGVSQAVRQIAEPVRAASDQAHPIAALSEPTGHGYAKTRPGTDQQEGDGCQWKEPGSPTESSGTSLLPFASSGRCNSPHGMRKKSFVARRTSRSAYPEGHVSPARSV